ncbi:unnamed protein product [Phytophthora fragariaefolia]|uniref:Unnamed protein product n=1 Tax=Phytophthora fragariaefolia TaxID=1490495 RepID=A0A9W6XSR4_9STRA|nr:unnamed protein product [Phytophthora fragariaefolia]
MALSAAPVTSKSPCLDQSTLKMVRSCLPDTVNACFHCFGLQRDAVSNEVCSVQAVVTRESVCLPSVLVRLLAVDVALPDDHVRVVGHRGHLGALRVERHAPHRGRVSRERLLAEPVVVVLGPDADSVVVAGRHEQVLRGVPGDELDVLRVAVQHGDALEVGVGVGLPDPDALVSAAGGQIGSGRAPGHALDLALVALEARDDLVRAALLLPDDGGGVEAHGREHASEHEDSEDEQLERTAWQDVDLNPAVELVAKLVREALDAGKTYNKSITAKTSQLLTGCDALLLELRALADARTDARQRVAGGPRGAACACGHAMAMLPLRAPEQAARAAAKDDAEHGNPRAALDEAAEDQTDRALARMEAAMGRLREMAELVQATSMQGEANLVSKVSLQTGTFQALEAAVQASAAAATATAIAHERGRSSSAFGRLYMPLQVHKLQEWYYSYPRPLLDELTLMRTILNYRPYANPFQVGGLSLAHVRDWFKRRRYRERMRYVKLAVEAGHDAQAAEEEIDLRLEQRIAQLRASVDPNELVKEVDRVRAQSYLFDAAVNAFTRPTNIRSYIAASYSVPTTADQLGHNANARGKRQRTQESYLDDIAMVKHATVLEVMALQNRLRSLMEQPKTTVVTNGLQQVVDLLRAMKVEPDVRIQTGLVADLKQILKAYTKPTLLRKATIALLESLGMNRRAVVELDADDDAPLSAPASPALSTASSARGRTPLKAERAPMSTADPTGSAFDDDASMMVSGEPPNKKAKPAARPAKPRAKEKKGRVLRPMKFSMDQLTALEAWFQQKYKPSQEEMENYLVQLNTPPLRDLKKQTVDVNMTQLRRWFNKRRCLRRPPFALMTQQEAAKEGSKNPAILKAVSTPGGDAEPVESVQGDEDVEDAASEIGGTHSFDDTNDDSSDDDDDDDDEDDDDDDDDDDGDDDSSDDGEHLIDQALA